MVPGSEDHECAWRDEAERLGEELAHVKADQSEKLAQLEAQLAALQRHVFGKRSEKMPPVAEELRAGRPLDPEAVQARRRAARAEKAELPEREVHHSVPPERRKCPKCGSAELRAIRSVIERQSVAGECGRDACRFWTETKFCIRICSFCAATWRHPRCVLRWVVQRGTVLFPYHTTR
ncbi:MAG: transposase domain-containing protein [Myxococcaceae bacterium]